MLCPYKETAETFGGMGQLLKLREECLELAEAITNLEREPYPSQIKIAHVYDESGDVLNVLRSLMTMTPAIEQGAATKMLRTQIRIRTGYYNRRQEVA